MGSIMGPDNNEQYLTDPDVRSMLKVQQGDRLAFETLMKKYFPLILNFIYRFLGTREAAEDLTQEVFLKVFHQAQNYVPRSSFKTWIYVIARNASLNELRRNKHRDIDTEITGEEIDTASGSRPEEAAIQNETTAQVREAIEQLPERQRTALILNRYDELSYEEIATIMKLSPKAIKSLLMRARESLKKILTPLLLDN